MKVLLFSSVCKDKSIYEQSINSYLSLRNDNFSLNYIFFNDNNENVKGFDDFITSKSINNHQIKTFKIDSLKSLGQSEYNHHNWDKNKIDRIIIIKNAAIKYAIENDYDYLFLVDTDLVLNPHTLKHLIQLDKDFVFEVFWTLFTGEKYYKPNAWDFHSWAYYGPETILKLAKPGTYTVGAGGACTLLSKKILQAGLNFSRLPSMAFQGEDRHFCTRAQALGFDIWVNTHYPCYHIHDEKKVNEALAWYNTGASPEFFNQWLNKEWEKKVIKSFKVDDSLLGKIRQFQYEIRRSYTKIFTSAK